LIIKKYRWHRAGCGEGILPSLSNATERGTHSEQPARMPAVQYVHFDAFLTQILSLFLNTAARVKTVALLCLFTYITNKTFFIIRRENGTELAV
jgi:hypothetical protein